MYKKTVKFEDFNGNEVTQDFYFHISEAELMNKEMSTEEGWSTFMERIIKEENKKKLVEEFEWFISFSYGIKSDDGLRFEKSDEIRESLKQHPAYGSIFMDIMADTKSAAEFVNGVFPRSLRNKISEVEEKTGTSISEMKPEAIRELAEEVKETHAQPTE